MVLQTHVGDDTDHRLRSDRFAKILRLGKRVIPTVNLDVDVEYDCCVVAQYPIADAKPDGEHLNLILQRGRTQCRARASSERNSRHVLRDGCGLLLIGMDLIQIYRCLAIARDYASSIFLQSPLCLSPFQASR